MNAVDFNCWIYSWILTESIQELEYSELGLGDVTKILYITPKSFYIIYQDVKVCL